MPLVSKIVFVVGTLVLAAFSGAYMAEIFRGGLNAIPKTQRDSARAIGLTQWQSFRLVILPQAVRLVLPAIAGQLVSLIKDSSLLSVIAISEFTLNARESELLYILNTLRVMYLLRLAI